MQHLYRHFGKDGKLLYVGVSLSAINRLSQHKESSHWFGEISRVTIEKFSSREEVLAAERKAIHEENPIHNIRRPTFKEERQSERDRRADDSRDDLVKRITKFNPAYTADQIADVLGMSASVVKGMIASGEIGSICVGERKGPHGTFKKLRVTGWQFIEFIEHLERKGKK